MARVHSDCHPENNAEIVYFVKAINKNNNFHNANVQYRDNGAISIGSFLRIPCPMPIDQYTRGDISLVVSHFTAILLQLPEYLLLIGTNNAIEANSSSAFVFNNTHITV